MDTIERKRLVFEFFGGFIVRQPLLGKNGTDSLLTFKIETYYYICLAITI